MATFPRRNLRDRSFKGQYLRGADFRGVDIRGCDFSGANLIGANFEQARAGISFRQQFTLIVLAISFAVATGDAIAFAIAGDYLIAVAISLAVAMVAAITTCSISGLLLAVAIAAGVTAIGNQVFAVAIALGFCFAVVIAGDLGLAITFSIASLFGVSVAVVCGFAGNLDTALALPTVWTVFTVALIFAGIVTFILDYALGGRHLFQFVSNFSIAAAVASNFAVTSVLSGALSASIARSGETITVSIVYAFIYVIISSIGAVFAVKALLVSIETLKNTVGTSFKFADLTDVSFKGAMLKNTDFSGAKRDIPKKK